MFTLPAVVGGLPVRCGVSCGASEVVRGAAVSSSAAGASGCGRGRIGAGCCPRLGCGCAGLVVLRPRAGFGRYCRPCWAAVRLVVAYCLGQFQALPAVKKIGIAAARVVNAGAVRGRVSCPASRGKYNTVVDSVFYAEYLYSSKCAYICGCSACANFLFIHGLPSFHVVAAALAAAGSSASDLLRLVCRSWSALRPLRALLRYCPRSAGGWS